MKRYIFDVETNGFLDELDRLHCLVIKDADTGERWSCSTNWNYGGYSTIEFGLELLENADMVIGHNIVSFDLEAIQKVYPTFRLKPTCRIMDTLVLARVIWPDIKKGDFERLKKGKNFPTKLIGKYSLEAFGYRIGNYKGDYQGTWAEWSQGMQDYCEQDVEVNDALWRKIEHQLAKHSRTDFIDLEHDVRRIVNRQERRGVMVDEKALHLLYAALVQRRMELAKELRNVFPPWFIKTAYFVPKRDNKARGYTAGAPLHKIELHEFNPSSRDDVGDRLIKLRGWEPKEYGKDGKPTIDDEILGTLPYPEAPLLAEYFMVEKRIGQVAEGQKGWLRLVKDGFIYGKVITNGAVTGRMIHFDPNLAQCPTNHAPYGKECRACFIARPGYKLVGADADTLELRCLAGYMAKYDKGAYTTVILSGDKSIGTDMHSVNAKALGLDPKAVYQIDGQSPTGRDIAKIWFYAFIYGAGDWKLGNTAGERGEKARVTSRGKRDRAKLLAGLPALGKLVEAVAEKVSARGFLVGLDGRHLPIRGAHAALNTLLQSAGAVFMKRALVILDTRLQEYGLVPGLDYEFILNIHDEWQIEVLDLPSLPEWVGQEAANAIRDAGTYYDFACPLAGNADVGSNWSETH